MDYIENLESKITKMKITDIDKLYHKFCIKSTKIRNKLNHIIEKERDVSVLIELENIINESPNKANNWFSFL